MLDDRTFGQTWVESRDRARPRGESAIRQELARKGLDRELIGEILDARRSGSGDGAAEGPGRDEAAASPDELAAERLLRKRAAALSRVANPRERRNRAYALLARNGFDPEVCRKISQSALRTRDEAGESDGDGGPNEGL
jgi:regulatory protein